jgi:parvulin-like peptidyl-prolyl isomerase
MPSRSSLGLLPVLCLVVAACADSGADPVAHVGDMPLPLAELEQYLSLNLLTDENDPAQPDEMNRVKSRLLDALIDQKRLLGEAERRGIEVSEHEIDLYVQRDDEAEPDMFLLTEDQERHLVRQRLLVRKLQDHLELQLLPPTDDEIQAYIGESRGRLAPQKRVQLRSLRFESADAAAGTATRIREGLISFADAAETDEQDPSQGVVLELPWGALPENVRTALDGLQPGQITRPVEFNGDTYLFKLEAWRKAASQMDEDLMRMARDDLVRQRRRTAGERLRSDLAGQTPARIHEEHLPFRYVPEAGA